MINRCYVHYFLARTFPIIIIMCQIFDSLPLVFRYSKNMKYHIVKRLNPFYAYRVICSLSVPKLIFSNKKRKIKERKEKKRKVRKKASKENMYANRFDGDEYRSHQGFVISSRYFFSQMSLGTMKVSIKVRKLEV